MRKNKKNWRLRKSPTLVSYGEITQFLYYRKRILFGKKILKNFFIFRNLDYFSDIHAALNFMKLVTKHIEISWVSQKGIHLYVTENHCCRRKKSGRKIEWKFIKLKKKCKHLTLAWSHMEEHEILIKRLFSIPWSLVFTNQRKGLTLLRSY